MPSAHVLAQAAVRQLITTPLTSADYGDIPGLFTELDIYEIAAREASWTTKDEVMKAIRQIQNLMHSVYKAGQVVRFGPVEVPGHAPDYLRFKSRIVYAGVEHAPQVVMTPNGVFGRVSAGKDGRPLVPGAVEDTFARSGRRAGTSRTDFEPWEHQSNLVAELSSVPLEDQREVERLKTELHIAQTKLERALRDLARQREHNARTVTREQALEAFVEAIDSRLTV